MLWTLGVILLILRLLALMIAYTMGGFIRLRQDSLQLAAERIGLHQTLRPDKMARRPRRSS